MLMSYIGALKAWLYMPIFSVFGVSAETIRVPIVIITLFSIIILYILCTKALNKKIALIAVLFFALAPSVIEHVRYDVGKCFRAIS